MPPWPRRALRPRSSPSAGQRRCGGRSLQLAEAGASSLCSRGGVEGEAPAGTRAVRRAGACAGSGWAWAWRACTQRCQPAPVGLGLRLGPVRGLPFPLRGVVGHDGRSPSLSRFPSFPLGCLEAGLPECLRWVPQGAAGSASEVKLAGLLGPVGT